MNVSAFITTVVRADEKGLYFDMAKAPPKCKKVTLFCILVFGCLSSALRVSYLQLLLSYMTVTA